MKDHSLVIFFFSRSPLFYLLRPTMEKCFEGEVVELWPYSEPFEDLDVQGDTTPDCIVISYDHPCDEEAYEKTFAICRATYPDTPIVWLTGNHGALNERMEGKGSSIFMAAVDPTGNFDKRLHALAEHIRQQLPRTHLPAGA